MRADLIWWTLFQAPIDPHELSLQSCVCICICNLMSFKTRGCDHGNCWRWVVWFSVALTSQYVIFATQTLVYWEIYLPAVLPFSLSCPSRSYWTHVCTFQFDRNVSLFLGLWYGDIVNFGMAGLILWNTSHSTYKLCCCYTSICIMCSLWGSPLKYRPWKFWVALIWETIYFL